MVITLALGIGANAAIFSVVRGVLLRPLVNRDEDRLIYIRQSAPGMGAENLTFSVTEVNDLKSRVTSIAAFGDFSTVDFTIVGLTPEPRVVNAGRRRWLVLRRDGSEAGARPTGQRAGRRAECRQRHRAHPSLLDDVVEQRSSVIGRSIRLGPRAATIIGVLEPSVPYPATTELIANVVSSPHHMSAMMTTSRVHRMTDLFGRLAPGATLEQARAELTAVHAAIARAPRATRRKRTSG